MEQTSLEVPAPTRFRTSLSPSRAGDFQACPLMFRFRAIDRLAEVPDPVMVRGTLVHAVLEDLFDDPAPTRTLERALALVGPRWERLQVEEERVGGLFDDPAEEARWLASCTGLLESYFGLEDPRWVEPAEREARVDHVLPSGLGLGGVVDRIDVAPDGRVRVVDYKTGRSPGERYEAKALFQMRFYALVLWRTRGVVPTVLQLYYLADGTVLQHSPTEAELLATERTVEALWQAVSRAVDTGDFPPNPGPACRWCSHRDLCPAFDGTPPPYPPIARVAADAPRAG